MCRGCRVCRIFKICNLQNVQNVQEMHNVQNTKNLHNCLLHFSSPPQHKLYSFSTIFYSFAFLLLCRKNKRFFLKKNPPFLYTYFLGDIEYKLHMRLFLLSHIINKLVDLYSPIWSSLNCCSRQIFCQIVVLG